MTRYGRSTDFTAGEYLAEIRSQLEDLGARVELGDDLDVAMGFAYDRMRDRDRSRPIGGLDHVANLAVHWLLARAGEGDVEDAAVLANALAAVEDPACPLGVELHAVVRGHVSGSLGDTTWARMLGKPRAPLPRSVSAAVPEPALDEDEDETEMWPGADALADGLRTIVREAPSPEAFWSEYRAWALRTVDAGLPGQMVEEELFVLEWSVEDSRVEVGFVRQWAVSDHQGALGIKHASAECTVPEPANWDGPDRGAVWSDNDVPVWLEEVEAGAALRAFVSAGVMPPTEVVFDWR